MAPFDSGRRLCLLVSAGSARYAIDAAAVSEVATPDADGENIRGIHALRDLSALLGGPPEQRPGVGVVLDVSPTLAVRVATVHEVADVAGAPIFRLPQPVGDCLGTVVRGALMHQERLYLELHCEGLSSSSLPRRSIAPPRRTLQAAPDQALVFESCGQWFGIALASVLQVATASQSFCALPWLGGPLMGLFPHVQGLWPVYSVAALAGGDGAVEPLLVLTEVAGQQVGLCASRVLGVQQQFERVDEAGIFESARTGTRALFLDLQHMFS